MQESNKTTTPIRILQISYDMSLGGAETLIMNLYRNIDRTKVQFDFLLHSHEKSAYEDEITSLGGKIYRIPRFLGYNKFSYDKDLSTFLLNHPEHRIIHDHLMDSETETFKVAKKLGRITVAHSHIAQFDFSINELIRSYFRKDICKFSDFRFACSEDAGNWLYKGKADFTVLKNGIETSNFCFSPEKRTTLRESLGLKEDELAIVNIGRFVEQKNHKRLISIFKEVVKLNEKAKLFLIGEGPLKPEIEKNVEELKLKDKVFFLGTRKAVNELLSAFDCFLFPSRFEGLGIVLIEAQASGLPCVFSDVIPSEAWLIPSLLKPISLEATNNAWAEAIISSKPLETREAGYILVKEAGYDIKTTAKELEKFYLDLAEGALN